MVRSRYARGECSCFNPAGIEVKFGNRAEFSELRLKCLRLVCIWSRAAMVRVLAWSLYVAVHAIN